MLTSTFSIEEDVFPLKVRISQAVSRRCPYQQTSNSIRRTLGTFLSADGPQCTNNQPSDVSMDYQNSEVGNDSSVQHEPAPKQFMPAVKLLPRRFKRKTSFLKSAICGILNKSRVTRGTAYDELYFKNEPANYNPRHENFRSLYGEIDKIPDSASINGKTTSDETTNPSNGEAERESFLGTEDESRTNSVNEDTSGDPLNHVFVPNHRRSHGNVNVDNALHRKSVDADFANESPATVVQNRSQNNDDVLFSPYFSFVTRNEHKDQQNGNDFVDENTIPDTVDSHCRYLSPQSCDNTDDGDFLNSFIIKKGSYDTESKIPNCGDSTRSSLRDVEPHEDAFSSCRQSANTFSPFISECFDDPYCDEPQWHDVIDLCESSPSAGSSSKDQNYCESMHEVIDLCESDPREYSSDTKSNYWNFTERTFFSPVTIRSSPNSDIENDCNFMNTPIFFRDKDNAAAKFQHDRYPCSTCRTRIDGVVEEGNEVYFCDSEHRSKSLADGDDADDGIDVQSVESSPPAVVIKSAKSFAFQPFVSYVNDRSLILEERSN